ncbi:NAD(P)-binding protein [Pluteus cervinus]|uniref:NAD(P)-binding protein n=1 Tax=Pluteus cervinus TaxID=181527 RepID=A0ACD3AW04_9AGAR|nr:NAD(P)-binding protein [Pluteus cervinus]
MGKFGPASKWLKDQREVIKLETTDLSGRVVLVIGANVGLGLEASRHFASMNPERLIMACRNTTKGEAAIKDVQSTTGYAQIDLLHIDLTDSASISKFIEELSSKGVTRIDTTLINAGMMTPKFELTVDGWETTLQTNHIGTALVALLLLPFHLATKHEDPFPRIAFVGSEVHYFVSKVEETKQPNILEALNDKKLARMPERYYITKTLNLFFARSLASRVQPGSLSVTAINPGFCKSQLIRNEGVIKMAGLKLATALLSRPTEMGSRCLVHGAVIASDEVVHGKYLNNCRVEEESDFVISEEGGRVQERVWKETIELLAKINPQITGIVDKYLNQPNGNGKNPI